jgi:uncharacterized heparinase superfamily protein
VSTLIELNREKHVQTIMRWAHHYAGLDADLRQLECSFPKDGTGNPRELTDAIDKVESAKRFLEHTVRQLLKAHYEAACPPVL